MKPTIGITMGDPAGVGPEILVKTARSSLFSTFNPVVFGDSVLLKRLRLPRNIPVLNISDGNKSFYRFGIPSSWGGRMSGLYIEAGVKAALKKKIDALVTLPINKEAFKRGGWGKTYAGHTEMLAALTKAKRVALMLVYKNFRAVHVTSHVALKNVSHLLSPRRIQDVIELTHEGLRKMGIRRPCLAVSGLNPHAGDNGLFGDEEKLKIAPAIRKCRSKNIHVDGPFSPDAVWPQVLAGRYDAGIAMYHDQGQIPLKLLSFRNGFVHGVNITLGLPIIRTSVAHGTAYEIAGKGVASIESFKDALQAARALCGAR